MSNVPPIIITVQLQCGCLLFQLDLAFDLVRKADAANRHRAGRGELLVALELILRQSLAYRLLDFALGAHPQYLEEFANAGIENILVALTCRVEEPSTASQPDSCIAANNSVIRSPRRRGLGTTPGSSTRAP
jgi:hypothetical protein